MAAKAGKVAKRKRRKKVLAGSVGLSPADVAGSNPPESVDKLSGEIDKDGGSVIGKYRDPLGGHWLVLAALPIEQVSPTPFQRDLSDAHAKRLQDVIDKTGRFLDPVIVVRQDARTYHTPNGHHRWAALKALGAKAITALVVPEPKVAYQILALNTEKAHNLREKSLEVVRMYRSLAGLSDAPEEDFSLEFEEAAYVTLGICYEARPRIAGGAYHPVLRRVDSFMDKPLKECLRVRQKRAEELQKIDDRISDIVEKLKARGLVSPYLKSFVVSRINPLRFLKGELPSYDDTLARLKASAEKFDPSKIQPQDLATSGAVGAE